MKKQRLNQKGFGHVLLFLIIVIVIGVIGFAGYRVINSKNDKKQSVSEGVGDGTKQTGDCNIPGTLDSAKGAFKEMPFKTDEIKVVTLGKETNDSRFLYPWVKNDKTNIYAPADGVLYKIRHKVYEVGGQKGNDYDIFFQVSCDTAYRFNHISNPRDDIKATYPAGNLPSGDYDKGGQDIAERVKPVKAIAVKAGDHLGYTTGTPGAHSFDFAVGVAGTNPQALEGELYSVCPFSLFNEPLKTNLMNLLGPKTTYTPQPGYPCDIDSKKF